MEERIDSIIIPIKAPKETYKGECYSYSTSYSESQLTIKALAQYARCKHQDSYPYDPICTSISPIIAIHNLRILNRSSIVKNRGFQNDTLPPDWFSILVVGNSAITEIPVGILQVVRRRGTIQSDKIQVCQSGQLESLPRLWYLV